MYSELIEKEVMENLNARPNVKVREVDSDKDVTTTVEEKEPESKVALILRSRNRRL